MLRWGDLAVVSASPEWFYQTRGERIVTRPIKGTRPRGASAAEDERLADELAASAKDRAELTMIVDLERNDLGRVCRYGSVVVEDALRVESFAQVHHLVATVKGRLRPDVGAVDVIRAVFPGGSITGAPKIRAMEIIDELEPSRRSLYTGAIGYLGRGGSSGFNIAIRTILVEGDRASYQVGGGIVADSDPGAEYEETLAKGRGAAGRAARAGGDRPMIWTRGAIVLDDALRIATNDRTFEHGLGLFETLRTWDGHPTLLDRHLDRMRRSAADLGLAIDPADLPDAAAVGRLRQSHPDGGAGDVRLRIVATGGTGVGSVRSVVWMTAGPLPPPSATGGARIGRTILVDPGDPLARHKTLNYWRRRIELARAADEGHDEVLSATPDGRLCEGLRSNVFLVRDGALLTPGPGGPMLDGVMRRVVIEQARAAGIIVVEGPLSLDAIGWADEAFLTNSVRGMLPVAWVLGVDLPAPGPVTGRLRERVLGWLRAGGGT